MPGGLYATLEDITKSRASGFFNPQFVSMSAFEPAWWLPGPHLQTIFPNVFRRRPNVELRRERWELDDGDFLDLDWTRNRTGPIVLILHGLEGSSESPYAAGMLRTVQQHGWRGALLHARGCSGEPNRLARRYHAGDTEDLHHVVKRLRAREPDTPLAVLGYSLGGSVLLNWLAESGDARPIEAAVAVSVPFDLNASAERLDRGLSRFYQRHLLQRLYAALAIKHQRMQHPLAERLQHRPASFRAFDDAYTAPLHGFADVADYYRRASCGAKLGAIRTPVLVLHALDDPFLGPGAVPSPEAVADCVELELHAHGGHVGFVGGPPWRPRYWLEERIPHYLAQRFAAASSAPPVTRQAVQP